MLKILFPILVLTGAVLLGKYFMDTGPEAKKKPFVQRLPVVEVELLKPQKYTVNLKASGIVRAGVQTNVVSQVSGTIESVTSTFLEGNYFNMGETLLKIDSSDYQNAMAIAESDVAGNRAALDQVNEEEKSTKRSLNLAKKNLKLGRAEVNRLTSLWKRKLVARSLVDAEEQKLNQLQQRLEDSQGNLNTYKSRKLAINAKIIAAQVRKRQEKLNITRATIKTPYQGRVLDKQVDIGQYVSTGTTLGTIYATDYVYVDLPLSLNRYELLGIPESFQNKKTKVEHLSEVEFNSPNSQLKSIWKGQLVRTSAALNPDSRQITVIARIDKPFEINRGITAPLRIGQYLEAKIKGKTFEGVYVLPPVAVRHNKEILLLDNGKIRIVPIELIWSTAGETIVKIGQDLSGKQLITTTLNQATDGMQAISIEDQRRKNKDKELQKNAATDTKKAN